MNNPVIYSFFISNDLLIFQIQYEFKKFFFVFFKKSFLKKFEAGKCNYEFNHQGNYSMWHGIMVPEDIQQS